LLKTVANENSGGVTMEKLAALGYIK
jgi:hypothetical protein